MGGEYKDQIGWGVPGEYKDQTGLGVSTRTRLVGGVSTRTRLVVVAEPDGNDSRSATAPSDTDLPLSQ